MVTERSSLLPIPRDSHLVANPGSAVHVPPIRWHQNMCSFFAQHDPKTSHSGMPKTQTGRGLKSDRERLKVRVSTDN